MLLSVLGNDCLLGWGRPPSYSPLLSGFFIGLVRRQSSRWNTDALGITATPSDHFLSLNSAFDLNALSTNLSKLKFKWAFDKM